VLVGIIFQEGDRLTLAKAIINVSEGQRRKAMWLVDVCRRRPDVFQNKTVEGDEMILRSLMERVVKENLRRRAIG